MKPHHGQIGVLSEKECIKVLEQGQLAHLGCHEKDESYVVPITYVFEGGYIYCHSRPGKKIEIMRKTPNICIQVEDVRDYFRWKSVIAWGRFEEVKGNDATKSMRMLIGKIMQKEEVRTSPLAIDFTAMLETAIIFRMKVDKITGRYEGSKEE